MYRKFRHFILFLITLGLSACLDEIELNVDSNESFLVVSGEITTNPGPYQIELARSAKFSSGAAGIPDRVRGASITLKDDQGNEAPFFEVDDGVYQTIPDAIQGTVGRSYYVEIEVDGQRYQSQPEKILPVVSSQSLGISFRNETTVNEAGNFTEVNLVTVLVDTEFPSDSAFLKWNTFGIYEFGEISSQGNINPDICYVTETIDFDNVAIASAEASNGPLLQGKEVLTRTVDFRFSAAYCFNVIQQSITKAAYEFWSAVSDEFERNGNIFETPPGKIRGNIVNSDNPEEEVLGIFTASAVDTMQLFVTPAEVGTPIPRCRPFPRPTDACFNCLSLPNSTLEKPSCWN